jgi:hypothetical protein
MASNRHLLASEQPVGLSFKAHWDAFESIDLATITLWFGELAQGIFGCGAKNKQAHCATAAGSDDEAPGPTTFAIGIPPDFLYRSSSRSPATNPARKQLILRHPTCCLNRRAADATPLTLAARHKVRLHETPVSISGAPRNWHKQGK